MPRRQGGPGPCLSAFCAAFHGMYTLKPCILDGPTTGSRHAFSCRQCAGLPYRFVDGTLMQEPVERQRTDRLRWAAAPWARLGGFMLRPIAAPIPQSTSIPGPMRKKENLPLGRNLALAQLPFNRLAQKKTSYPLRGALLRRQGARWRAWTLPRNEAEVLFPFHGQMMPGVFALPCPARRGGVRAAAAGARTAWERGAGCPSAGEPGPMASSSRCDRGGTHCVAERRGADAGRATTTVTTTVTTAVTSTESQSRQTSFEQHETRNSQGRKQQTNRGGSKKHEQTKPKEHMWQSGGRGAVPKHGLAGRP